MLFIWKLNHSPFKYLKRLKSNQFIYGNSKDNKVFFLKSFNKKTQMLIVYLKDNRLFK